MASDSGFEESLAVGTNLRQDCLLLERQKISFSEEVNKWEGRMEERERRSHLRLSVEYEGRRIGESTPSFLSPPNTTSCPPLKSTSRQPLTSKSPNVLGVAVALPAVFYILFYSEMGIAEYDFYKLTERFEMFGILSTIKEPEPYYHPIRINLPIHPPLTKA